MLYYALLAACVATAFVTSADDSACSQVLGRTPVSCPLSITLSQGADEESQRTLFLCQLHESAALLEQLSELVTDGVAGLLDASGGLSSE